MDRLLLNFADLYGPIWIHMVHTNPWVGPMGGRAGGRAGRTGRSGGEAVGRAVRPAGDGANS